MNRYIRKEGKVYYIREDGIEEYVGNSLKEYSAFLERMANLDGTTLEEIASRFDTYIREEEE